MRVHALIAAAALALAAPMASHAADMAVDIWSPSCGGLQPVDVYVPPQVAYIVACTVPLPPPTVSYVAPAKHGLFGKHGWKHGADDGQVAVVDWGYGNPATHEGKLVYLQQWSADRPPVHLLIAPK